MQSVYYVHPTNDPSILDLTICEHLNFKTLNIIPSHGFYLYDHTDRRILRHVASSLELCVDFTGADIQNRITPNTAKLDLVKAIEGKNKSPLYVLDMTAGLGQDSFSLAARGHNIDALEQNPYVFLLLHDGLRRAKADDKLAMIANRIRLYWADAMMCHEHLSMYQYDVVYLDPMFPARSKSAKVKKNMQLLHELVGIDVSNNLSLFQQAQALHPKKIVVKRPRLGEFLSKEKPTSQIIGKSSRFDIYAID